ncbi:MAG: radical SAM protein [Crocinitomicaceae bacterium]|nr:radical SAM protein [Crocinitomicaceae bacterium]
MKPSVELFKLIKSLSKSEKRFFKLSSSLQSGEKNYIKIFDFIDAQKEYNEESLKQEFKNEVFVKHLSSEKNYLYKLILKSLRNFYSEESPESILKQEIKNIEILFSKALYKECGKYIQRAKELAKGTENFYYWNEIISWEKWLIEDGIQETLNEVLLEELIKEEIEVVEKLRNLAEYQIIYSRINNIFRSGGFIRSKKEEEQVASIADYHLIKGKNTALSVRATSMCYYIKGLCAATNRNYEDSYLYFNKTRDVLDRNPIIKADLATRYIQGLTHLLRCYIDGEQFDKAEQLIIDLRNLREEKGFKSVSHEIRIMSNSYLMELLLLQRQGKFQKTIDLIDNIGKFIAEYEETLTKEQRILFMYYKSVSYFAVGEFKKSLLSVNEILNDNEKIVRQDIFSFARIFNLVLHFELGNYDFTEYAIKSVNRYLSKRERDYETETLLIKVIKSLSKANKPEEQLVIFKSLKKDLKELFKDKHEQAILEYFNLNAWIESKLSNTTYEQEIIKILKAN